MPQTHSRSREDEGKGTMKYLIFNELDVERKTKVFEVRNQKLDYYFGDIEWDCGWRQYIFSQRVDEKIKMSRGCLKEIYDFLDKLMEERK